MRVSPSSSKDGAPESPTARQQLRTRQTSRSNDAVQKRNPQKNAGHAHVQRPSSAVTRHRARKKRHGLRRAFLSLLVLAVAFFALWRFVLPDELWDVHPRQTEYPGAANLAMGLTDVSITAADLDVPALSATVSPEQPEVRLNGTMVNFGAYNLPGEKALAVKKLSAKTDAENGFSIQPYDFELEGMSEFVLPVLVEMAYEPTVEDDLLEANRIFVQHYDEAAGWRLIPSWIDTESNTVTILTNHFSTIGVFEDTRFQDAEGVVSLFRYLGDYRGPTTPVYTTGNAIDANLAYIDESIFQTFIDTRTVPVRDAASGVLDLMNHETSGTTYALFANSQAAYDSLSPTLGKAGMLFVFSKMANQWYNGVATEDIILDNAFNLGEIALSGTGAALAAPELTLAAAGVWAVGLTYDVGTAGYEYIRDSDARYVAYRDFSEYGQIIYLPDEGKCVYIGERNDPTYEFYEADYARRYAIDLMDQHGWAQAFASIQKKFKDDPRKITSALETLLESYLDVFWTTDGSRILAYLQEQPAGMLGLGTMADDWVWPTEGEIEGYKAAYRVRMKEFLRPIMKAMCQKELLSLREQTFQAVVEAWPLLNTEIRFEVRDAALPDGKYFPQSPLSEMYMAFSPLSDAAIPSEWVCAERHERSDVVFTCNLYAYIKAGCPGTIHFWGTQADEHLMRPVLMAPFALSMPTTVVSVGSEMEISGIYTGTSQGKILSTGETSTLYYPAVRIEETGTGLTVGPCLENGDYESELQVPCVYNSETGVYEGSVYLETGSQWTQLIFAVEMSVENGKQRAQVAYVQHFSAHASRLQEYDVAWNSPLTGNAVSR